MGIRVNLLYKKLLQQNMRGILIAQVLFDCTEAQGGFVPKKSLNIKIEECQVPEPIVCETGQDCPKWDCSETGDELSCEARCSGNNELAKKQKCSCYERRGPLKFFTGCKWVVEQEEKSCAAEKIISSTQESTINSENIEENQEIDNENVGIEEEETDDNAENTEQDTFSDCRALNEAKFWKCDRSSSHKAKCRLPCRNQLNIINRCFCVKGLCKWTLPLDTRCKKKTVARPTKPDTEGSNMLFDINTNDVRNDEQYMKQEPEEPEFPRVRSRIQMIRAPVSPKTYRGMRYIEKDGRRLFNQNDLISQFLSWFKINH